MKKRKQVSKKAKFEVFKRDLFTCQYCGNRPPDTILELDHIIPVSKGGGNETSNLTTSCVDCNRGKSSTPLSEKLPEIDNLEERKYQEKACRTQADMLRLDRERTTNYLEKIYASKFRGAKFTDEFKVLSMPQFLSGMSVEDVEYAMAKAVTKVSSPEKCIQYFCGICWKRIRGENRYPWPSDRR